MVDDMSALWDAEAATMDEAPDHGLHDPVTREAWRQLLLSRLGDGIQTIADLGCGTGTLAVLLAEEGHHVEGVDFSPEMLRIARTKAATVNPAPTFIEADAAAPPLSAGSFDVVLCRHVLWTMADAASALRNWIHLLKPNGRLILIEGNWSTGAGLTAKACSELVQRQRRDVEVERLDDPALWGGPISDERYILVSRS